MSKFVNIRSYRDPLLKDFDCIDELKVFLDELMSIAKVHHWTISMTERSSPSEYVSVAIWKGKSLLFRYNILRKMMDNQTEADDKVFIDLTQKHYDVLLKLFKHLHPESGQKNVDPLSVYDDW